MRFLHDYIALFRDEGTKNRIALANELESTKNQYDIFMGGDPESAFEAFVDRYNWLGDLSNKKNYNISQNLARNLPGALMQDFLLHLMVKLCMPYPKLDIFTEVRVPFGRYPVWDDGEINIKMPGERSDLAVGYRQEKDQFLINEDSPKGPIYKLQKGQSVWPLITVNSKIRVSQSEFFDWLGREQLMTKGNPHCLSIQVALRKEMDLSIIDAAQSEDKFFLLGIGGERSVTAQRSELNRLIETVATHLKKRMI